MSLVYDMDGEPRYYGLYYAFVVDNVDPLKMGRVKFTIPGLVEPESPWAWPIGMGGGSAQNGGWDVPKRGAAVGAMFHGGDIDEPVYFLGWYGRGEAPGPANDASAADAADKIKCFESDRHLVVLDGVKEQVLIKDKSSGNVIVMKGDEILLGQEDGLGALKDGVVLASGIDSLTGATYGALGSASRVVMAKK